MRNHDSKKFLDLLLLSEKLLNLSTKEQNYRVVCPPVRFHGFYRYCIEEMRHVSDTQTLDYASCFALACTC